MVLVRTGIERISVITGMLRALTLGRVVAACALVMLGILSVARGAEPPPAPVAAPPPPAGLTAVPGLVYAENIAVITIKGEITQVTARSVERRIKRAVDGGANAIVIEVDTPGGEIYSMLQVCQAIETCPVHTIAWVNNSAISAGAVISLTCREIVLSDGALMGDAAPVNMLDPNSSSKLLTDKLAVEKFTAPTLAQIVDAARRNGYDETLVQGFVFPGVETWQVERVETGRSYFLTEPEYVALFDRAPDRGTSMVASGSQGIGAWPTQVDPSVVPAPSATSFRPASGVMDSQMTERVNEYLSSETASVRPDFSKEDPSNYRLIGYATDGQTLLTLKEGQLRSFGLVRHASDIDTDAELMAYVGAKHMVRLDQTWVESVVGYMTQGMTGLLIRGVLIVVFLLAMFLELSIPGMGIPGIVAICALALLVVPPMMIGASTWWAVGAILGGVGLILLEILVLPGFGIPGILGMLLMLSGLIGTFASSGELFPGTGSGGSSQALWATTTVLLALFAAGAGMFFLTKYTRSIPIANRLVLFEKQSVTGEDRSVGMLQAMGPAHADGPVSIGEIGVATTPLKPSGTAEFHDRFVDVVAEFGFIDPGQRVRVVSVTPFRVGVETVGGATGPGLGSSGDQSMERSA